MAGDNVKDLHIAIVGRAPAIPWTSCCSRKAPLGAGIGGLALAMALHKRGVLFTLYEEAEQYSVVGAGIGLGPNGLQSMDLIEEGFRPKYEAVCVGNKPPDAQHVFFEGLLLQKGLGLEEAWYGHSSWGHPDFTRKSAHRKEVLDIMTSFIPIESVKFGKSLKDIQQLPDKVKLIFADGEVAEASALVGADGIKSLVREHVLKPLHPTEVEPVYADSYCYRGVIPINEAEDILGDLTDVAKFYFGDKRSAVTYRISGGTEFNFLLNVADTDRVWQSKRAVTEKVTYEAMMADFEGHGVDERFLRLLSKAQPIRWGLFHHRYTSTYFRDRVVLIGDSAHASLPFQAAGAAQGLEDALVLSKLLAKLATSSKEDAELGRHIRAAFDGYDSVRRPRAQKQLEQSAELGLMIHFQDPKAGSDMNKILPRLQHGRFEWLWFHDLTGDIRSALKRMDDVLQARAMSPVQPA
ncbi:hypothetical protein H2200_011128 [Cladophialophora chaetospira]|uniref:FAD-binding domain-containing protein n=1 Tax=Cladophialophora chaetospira TaxID=386627 RepID=A0AA39CDI8_9EURO|nr:hypothetical protein H2200_011128 [Cladophialophora chaetospira]